MRAREWWDSVGTKQAKTAVEAAGSKWSYFKHIAAGRKRPGVDLARAMVEASRKFTPGFELSLNELLVPAEQLKK